MDFQQQPATLTNQYLADVVLQSYLKRHLPSQYYQAITSDLISFGERVSSDILHLAESAEATPPQHIPYDPWGKRIDHVQVSPAWEELHRISAMEGIVAIGYERQFAEHSRLYQFAKLYLFHPSSAIYSCPLAMTDGAARVLELHGTDQMKTRAFKNLTSRNPAQFWTSGQWMTEKTGGSDVSGTTTVARLVDGEYRLYGTKWFTSATTSQMAMALAKIDNDPSGKLSLFYVELRDDKGDLKNIQINRLKDKLGTKALPTAELTLQGTPATLIGEQGKGVKTIATLFNITRVYNACCAVGYMRRGIALASDYARKRQAFGKNLIDHPTHASTLSELQVRFAGSFHLTFHAALLLGREETGIATAAESAILRLLIPLAKLFTAKEGVAIASEVLESFGGAGYIEDTGLPVLLRNAQVLSIWEGTTNVLSLDALRAIHKEKAAAPFIEDMRQQLKSITHSDLKQGQETVLRQIEHIEKTLQASEEQQNSIARTIAFHLAHTYAASLLLSHAQWELNQGTGQTPIIAQRWCKRPLPPLVLSSPQEHLESVSLI